MKRSTFSFVVLLLSIGSVVAQSSWPVFRHDPAHSGRSDVAGPVQPALKWKFKTNGSISASPVVGTDGIVYIGSSDSCLYAIKPDGTQKWKFGAEKMVFSTPALAKEGTIYFGAANFLALKPDGSVQWKFTPPYNIGEAVPMIGPDGIIYIGSADLNLFALNPDGTEKWRFKVDAGAAPIVGAPALDANGNLYFGCSDYRVYSANSANGTRRWRFESRRGVISSPAVGKDAIYIGSSDSCLYALNPNGSKRWEFKTKGWVSSSPAIGSDGTIYVGSMDSCLYAINPNGSEKWRFKTQGGIASSPAIDNHGVIYVGSIDACLYAVNSDGTEKWRFKTEDRIESSPAIGPDGTVYFGSYDTYVYALISKER
jgi:outer membrane protein assembly factor BamB